MHRLAEKCGIMAISRVLTAGLIVFALQLWVSLNGGGIESAAYAILSLVAALPITAVLATCVCIARYTDPERRAW